MMAPSHSLRCVAIIDRRMLRITPNALALIRQHAAAAFPEECCGLLIGNLDGDQMQVVDALPARNLATSNRSTRYTLDPRGFLFAQGQALERKLDVIGVYHSHPEHPAEPSATDSQL